MVIFLLWIQDNIRNDILTPIVKFITSLGNAGMIWIAITLILLIFKKTRKLGGICALSLISSLVINNFILKNLVARVRPYDQISALNLIIEKQKDWSFPSRIILEVHLHVHGQYLEMLQRNLGYRP